MFGNPRYPTYQVFLAAAISAVITMVVMPFFIKMMRHEGVGQQVRADGPEQHLIKQGTPTMGGVVMLFAVFVTCCIQAHWTHDLRLAMAAMLATGSLGLLDDIESVAHKRSLGLTPSQKMIGLVLISVLFCLGAINIFGISPMVEFPGGFTINLGILATPITIGGKTYFIYWLYMGFVFLLMAGLSNAVNLTDGLDGLAGGCTVAVMMAMSMVAFSYNYLNLSIFAASIAGACVGFLWFNGHPATIFMGDTGSLALGAAFAALAVLTKTEITSLVMGGLFIAEALSVIIQVASFKMTGKRVFLMAPIHHHFEELGWDETKVVLRFWLIAAAFAVLGFALFFKLG